MEDQAFMKDQKVVDQGMEKLAKEFKEVFEGREGVRPVVQP